MISISRKKAENRFAAIEKRQQTALSAQEEAARARDEKTARLRSARLATEAAKLSEGTKALLQMRAKKRSKS